ncbi:MAG: 2-C-methyl-D-erythritol 4-phosphate cytidylyltransferase [Candidatus Cloacimonetes bacterium]|nr:2-C-methyl-D-erythritol 4-phosphate cytidylyltransferase [Candidatus Cloacimonadota bacterium]
MTVIGIILSGGIGSRMDMDKPKQYIEICGRSVLSYSIDAFKQSPSVDDFFVVADSEENIKHIESSYNVKAILGGDSRNISFSNALDYISENYRECIKIVVNEAARPMITSGLIEDFVKLLDGNSCVYCVKDVTDSLETVEGHYVDRKNYRLVMSPEGYDFRVIRQYFSSESETTFPGHSIPDGYSKHVYKEYINNIKITYRSDISIIENLLSSTKK